MRMIFIFIDGFGIGEDDERKNPITRAKTPFLDKILGSFSVIPTDASMGIEGLPQSATGQTAIFTGVNASKVLGRHLHGQPTVTLKTLLEENNLFKELIKRGFKVTNANIYRQEYLDKMKDTKERRYKPSVTSVMTMSCGLDFRTVEQYREGKGVYHDITGQILLDSGYDVGLITPEEAALRLYTLSREYDFTLYEHFMTDMIGHTMDMEKAVSEVELLDKFLGALVELINFEEDILCIASDHGNIEDMSVKTHTLNKVPTMFLRKMPHELPQIQSLYHIMPAILEIFDKGRRK